MTEQSDRYADMLDRLANMQGIMAGYWDIAGVWHAVTPEAKKAILAAMGIRTDSSDAMEEELRRRERQYWTSLTDPVHVIDEGAQPFILPVRLPCGQGDLKDLSVFVRISDEVGRRDELLIPVDQGDVVEEHELDGVRYARLSVTIPGTRAMGYFDVAIDIAGCGQSPVAGRSRLIIAPDVCYLPDDWTGLWGLAVNLYALHSGSSWGVGDFSDLRQMVTAVGGISGSFVGLNPLHAIPNTNPYGRSPYSPVSRLYRNIVYLDMEAVPDIAESDAARAVVSGSDLTAERSRLRELREIDYEAVAALKMRAIRPAFEHFHAHHYQGSTERGVLFREYLKREGGPVRCFGTYLCLHEHFRNTIGAYGWQEWPEDFRDPEGAAVRAYQAEHEKEILLYCYIQWLLDLQLKEVQDLCVKSGMKVGLYHDLAVGAIGGGSDIWQHQELAGKADAGAPPDDFNPNGQNWGFPALIPERLRENGYELFIRMLRQNMRHGGALRIDHALGLFRLYWVPSGMSAREGAYVLQPAADLLRIIALESRRNRTVVIAEDLGTIDEEFRKLLQDFRMLSYRLFYFERNYPDPSFKAPEQYVPTALCAVTTHDLPTLYGYWEGHDIDVKERLGIYADASAARQDREARQRDRGLLLAALKAQGLLPGEYPDDPAAVPLMTPELCSAVYGYLARTPCRLVLASLDDIIGTRDQQNLPGTVDQHPNWVQKTPLTTEDICSDPRFLGLRDVFRRRQ